MHYCLNEIYLSIYLAICLHTYIEHKTMFKLYGMHAWVFRKDDMLMGQCDYM